MDAKDALPQLNGQILEEAGYWLVELNSEAADPGLQGRFQTWLRTSPEHVRAYLELVAIWESGAEMPLEGEVSVETLIAAGRAPDNVVALRTGFDSPRKPAATQSTAAPTRDSRDARALPRSGKVRGGGAGRRWLAVTVPLFATALGVVAWLSFVGDPTYETGVGQQESFELADGSTIELNARSKVRVHLTEHRRRVELLDGQALFRVAKDPGRPFVVESDRTRIRAVGTEFDVSRRNSATTVTVLEGRVAVLPDTSESDAPSAFDKRPAVLTQQTVPPAARALLLNAGEQVTVTAQTAPKPKRADVAAATAWTQRRLVFDASTLAEVIEEFNRYNTRRLVLRDTSLARFPISGSFSSTDPSSLVHFLEIQPGIRVTVRDSEIDIAATP
jgi:transmembrane sensor